MTTIQVGRIVVKTNGREAGKKAVIVDLINPNYVLVTGPKTITSVRRRRCNIGHIEPTDKVISIKRDASDEEVIAAIEKDKMKEYMEEAIVPKV
ncbi:MAG: 50S ribosomal protein L14e [Candidatus Heimdallarchaeota archaeon]|nr:50S ribosomal protein L14e [Candidatus Heimdallarchaeota archaeon]MCK4953736.1 50S ribosomal protein L14e [Candidatus Heimdallarchaeota archaeon]